MLLIDTYNVLHTVGVLPPEFAGLEVEDLAELVAVGRSRSRGAILVCDGMPRARTLRQGFSSVGALRWRVDASEKVQIIFAGENRDADTWIEVFVEADSHPRRLSVVSSDRRVQRAARKRRAEVIPSPAFLRQLIYDAEASAMLGVVDTQGKHSSLRAQVPLSMQAILYWKRAFGVTDADAPASSARPKSVPPTGSTPATGTDKPSADEHGARARAVPKPAPPPPRPKPMDDPELREALKESRDEVDPDDLDMSKWIGSSDDSS